MFAKRLSPEVYPDRRARLSDQIGDRAVALIPASVESIRNSDVHYPHRQDSDFYYLTGFAEPDAVAVLLPGHEHSYVLFCRDRDPEKEIWNGRRAGPEGAVKQHGAAAAYPLSEIDQRLPELITGREQIYYAIGSDPALDRRVMGWVNQVRGKARQGVQPPTGFVDLKPLLNEMRLCKQPEEVAVMREAARISAEAHIRAMQTCKPGMMEYEIEAELLYTFTRQGATWAYPSIVAGGANGCILHYVENNQPLKDGDLLLIDAGAEIDGYDADITRTFPVNGRFSPEQRLIYQLVLDAQHAAIAEVQPDNHFNQPHEAAVRVLTAGLVNLGLLTGPVQQLIDGEAYKKFYMHRTGHWLGMDVHDVGLYKQGDQWQNFEPGMVTTIEPGLYIAAADDIDPRWWNIGVRIEDDVLVTEQGCQILTSAVPKDIAAIESLMKPRLEIA